MFMLRVGTEINHSHYGRENSRLSLIYLQKAYNSHIKCNHYSSFKVNGRIYA